MLHISQISRKYSGQISFGITSRFLRGVGRGHAPTILHTYDASIALENHGKRSLMALENPRINYFHACMNHVIVITIC